MLLVMAASLAACSPAATESTETAPLRAVRVAAVESGPAQPPVVATGVVAAAAESRLAFKTAGVIREITVQAGDTVRAGERLARLETTEIDAAVAQARAAFDKAQRDLERGRGLFADDVLTQEQLDALETAAAVARAQLDAAEYNRRYAEIVAPADGRVLRRLAEPRELVAPGQPILEVSRGGDGWTLRLGVPDRDFVRLRDGDAATLRFDAHPGRAFAGRVSLLGGAADPRSGTFPVEIGFDAGDARFAAGMIGRAEIAVGNGQAQLSYVPLSALVEGSGEAMLLFVYDADTGAVAGRRVPVAFVSGTRAALAEPLPAGAQVVTDGAAYLRDGEAVRVVN
ncbi:efflux RND transporter periplasmic adaptor subunit [Sinimarinibacterium thermocellulolyticum]|uniref:efflux RND transporter periplasmic adaptor subunit n=1 Tax=Sinimarinibacterium thermocellulolyticum TaxID=3170016 RepID=UPI0033385ECB